VTPFPSIRLFASNVNRFTKVCVFRFVSALLLSSNNQRLFASAGEGSAFLPSARFSPFFKHVGCILSAFGLALDLLVCGSDTSSPTYKRHQTPMPTLSARIISSFSGALS
jgi:hypothetical protein